MESAIIMKEDGAKQRIDVALTQPIAHALADLMFAGVTLYPKSKGAKLKLMVGEEGEKTLVELPAGTFVTWISRGNIIPETGESLKSFLDGKREEKRLANEQARQSVIRENAEKRLEELSGIKIKPVESKKTYRYTPQGERFLVKEETIEGSAKLSEVVLKGLQFGLERLAPERYGAKAEVQHNHFIFDLAKLRQARQARDAMRREEL